MTLTAAGLTIKTTATIREEIRAAILAVMPQAQLGAQSALGRTLDIVADREALLWQVIQAIYQSFDPDQAAGAALDNLCALTGVTRNPATHSLGTVTATGVNGTVIASGSLVRIPSGAQFETTAVATIPILGAVDIAAQSVDTGPVEAVATAVSEIVTITAGWTGVTNAVDFTLGTIEETDGQLRVKREQSLQIIGTAVDAAIRARVLQVDTVTQARCISNRQPTVDALGIPGHAFRVVIWPVQVDYTDVWSAIFHTMPAGMRPDGSICATVTDDQGLPQTVCVELATEAPIHVLVEVGGTNLPGTVVADIQALLAAVSYLIGGTVSIYQLSCLISDSIDGVEELRVFTREGAAPTAIVTWQDNITAGADEIPTIDTLDVDVTVL